MFMKELTPSSTGRIVQPGPREMLLKGAAGAMALAGLEIGRGRPAFPQSTTTIVATPAETEGPYFVDEKLNRSDIRVDPSNNSDATGFPLLLGITVSRIRNNAVTPLTGAYVDLWHCNALGIYSDVQSEATVGRKYLRGYQVTDPHGNVRFLTVYPGWYMGRAVHMHFKVRLYTGAQTSYEFTSQLYFNDSVTDSVYTLAPYNQRGNRDTRNTADGIYNGGGSGSQLLLRLGQGANHATSSFHIQLNA